jgi:hypothetical protein
MNLYLLKAIKSLRPNSEFSFTNDDYSTIKWDVLEGDAPTQAEIDAEIVKIKADEEFLAAQRAVDKADLLTRLGITADEAALLLS